MSIELEQLTTTAAGAILEQLPDRIRATYVEWATRLNYPVEALLEMALAGYLDGEAMTYGRS